jgi:hypothetical protein
VHSDWLSPPLTLTALPPLTVTLVLAELCQTITTDSRHSMCKHRRHQQARRSAAELWTNDRGTRDVVPRRRRVLDH